MSRESFGPHRVNRVAIVPGDGDHVEARCFADDVVIDFPSVALAVDRIRRGFLADESPARWKTTVRLSGEEARRGSTVPLEVPVRLTCHHCGGRGESWAERCRDCMGSGSRLMHHVLQVSIPAGVLNGDRFRFTVVPRWHAPTPIELQVLVS
jgi:hypothetical protein